MPSRPILPVTPPPPAMAEVLFAFEHSDPDACALLLPWQADVAFGQLEVRARRQHPELPPLARADLVTRATALYDLVVAETARRADKPVGETAPPPVTEPERQRRRDLLLAEVTRNPALAAEEGRRFLEAELGISIPKGTFYGGYWNGNGPLTCRGAASPAEDDGAASGWSEARSLER